MSDECPGANRCHGCACWCDECGDVDERQCDNLTCDAHHCAGCGAKTTVVERDYATSWFTWCFACCVRRAMEYAIALGYDEVAAGEAEHRSIEAFRELFA